MATMCSATLAHMLSPHQLRDDGDDKESHSSDAGAEAKFFRGLGDTTRMRILNLLLDCGEQSVSCLVASLGLPRSNVSVHLACLKSCGYVAVRKAGRFVYYQLADQRVRQILLLARSISGEHCEELAACQTIDGVHPIGRSGSAIERQNDQPAEIGPSCCCGTPSQAKGTEADIRLTFGPWLHRRLVSRRLQPRDLAAAMGVSTSAVRRWLSRGGYPSPELRPQLAEVLEVGVEEVRQRVRAFPSPAWSPFAAWLDVELQARDWTRAELARQLGLTEHSIAAWFTRGLRPRQSTRLRLAQLLRVPIGDIPAI